MEFICALLLNIATDWYNEPCGRWIEMSQLQLQRQLQLQLRLIPSLL
jgi:hypothetical protein